jgi:hypothetical protein
MVLWFLCIKKNGGLRVVLNPPMKLLEKLEQKGDNPFIPL